MDREKMNIQGEAFEVGFSFRAINLYEQQTGKSISECNSTWDFLNFFYCTLKALNKHFKYSFEEFVDLLDREPELLHQFRSVDLAKDKRQPAPEQAAPETQAAKKKASIKERFGLWMLFLLLLVSPVLIPVISGIAWIWQSLRLLVALIARVGKKRV